jgi:orotidine-5'-phosphate decarboxylase
LVDQAEGRGRRDAPVAAVPFPDRLAALVEERRSQIVLGLDPDPSRLWQVAVGAESVDEAVTAHCRAVIEATASACVAVKLQLACFERLGTAGWVALENTVAAAREHGLLVLADGKRGDVPVTAEAYAQGLAGETPTPFGPVPGLGADAFTANPLLGRDSLAPLIDSGAGCFLLVRTSNPGAADVQDLVTNDGPVYEVLARMVTELGADRIGDCGLSSVGAVTGATRPDLLARLRELMPHAVFLLPGVGAQGGAVDDLAAAFEPHPAAGLVAASRSIVDAGDAAGAAEEMRRAAWALAC